MEILKVENLCKQYGKGENKVTALDNVSFTVNRSIRKWKINTITFNRRS